jgi:hypothetical protein
MSNFAADYIDVATRIAQIKGDADRQYPNGSFQPADLAQPFRIVTIEDTTYIAYVAAFYRSDGDTKPGIGSAWEQVPGRTQFTRGSELQNAETSAWGRALIAALAADTKKGIASADEVRNRQDERDNPPPRAPRTRGATERKSAEQVASEPDPWATATPAPEPERVTDTEWIEGFRTRVTAAGSASELRGLQGEANGQWSQHRLSREDAAALRTEVDARMRELTGAST